MLCLGRFLLLGPGQRCNQPYRRRLELMEMRKRKNLWTAVVIMPSDSKTPISFCFFVMFLAFLSHQRSYILVVVHICQTAIGAVILFPFVSKGMLGLV